MIEISPEMLLILHHKMLPESKARLGQFVSNKGK